MKSTGIEAPHAILVVDDAPANLVAYRAALEPLGREIVTAQGLTQTRETTFFLADQDCPEMSPKVLQDSRTAGPPGDDMRGIHEVGRTSVLLVEDDVAIARSLAEVLQEEGLRVVTAGNGREALQILKSGVRPSAIVLDLMMPVMDGWDFRGEQLRDPALKDIPVVVVTATGFSPETIRMQFGKVGILPKPVPYLDLLDMLGHAPRS